MKDPEPKPGQMNLERGIVVPPKEYVPGPTKFIVRVHRGRKGWRVYGQSGFQRDGPAFVSTPVVYLTRHEVMVLIQRALTIDGVDRIQIDAV